MLRGRADSGDEVNHQPDEPLPPVPHEDDHSHHSLMHTAQTTLQRLMTVGLNPCEKYIKFIVIGFNALVLLFSFVLIGVGSAALNGDYNSLTSTSISSGIIVLGVFFLLLALLGIVSAWREHRPLLGVYFVFLLLLCFITLIVGIAVYAEKDSANYYITTAWQNIFKGNPTSQVLRDLSFYYDCCGLSGTHDMYTPVVKIYSNLTNATLGCDPLNITAPGVYILGCTYQCPTDQGYWRPCEPLIEQSFYTNFSTAGACGIAFAVLMAVFAVFIVLLFRGIGGKRSAEATAKAVSEPVPVDEPDAEHDHTNEHETDADRNA